MRDERNQPEVSQFWQCAGQMGIVLKEMVATHSDPNKLSIYSGTFCVSLLNIPAQFGMIVVVQRGRAILATYLPHESILQHTHTHIENVVCDALFLQTSNI